MIWDQAISQGFKNLATIEIELLKEKSIILWLFKKRLISNCAAINMIYFPRFEKIDTLFHLQKV